MLRHPQEMKPNGFKLPTRGDHFIDFEKGVWQAILDKFRQPVEAHSNRVSIFGLAGTKNP